MLVKSMKYFNFTQKCTELALKQQTEVGLQSCFFVTFAVLPPKSLADLARTPHFMGLCAGIGLLAFMVIIALIKEKAK